MFRYQSSDPQEQYREIKHDNERWRRANCIVFGVVLALWFGVGAAALGGYYPSRVATVVSIAFVAISALPVLMGLMIGVACRSLSMGLSVMCEFFYLILFYHHHHYMRFRASAD